MHRMNIIITGEHGEKEIKQNCKPMNEEQKRDYKEALIGATTSLALDRHSEEFVFYVITDVEFED